MENPSLQDLYSLETHFESAFLQLIRAAASPDRKIFLEFSDLEKKTPFTEFRLTDIKPDAAAAPEARPDGREDYARWEALLVCRVTTTRGANSDVQNDYCGWIRTTTLEILTQQDLKMPYHFVSQVSPGATIRTHDPDFGLDISELQFPLIIEINRENF